MCGLLTLAFAPGACEWAYARGEAVARLAIADAASGAVHVFDGRDGGGPTAGASPAAPLLTVALHAHPVRCLRFNPPLGCVVSSDAGGQLELWSPWTGTFAASSVSFRFKADTDLYAHAAAKTAPLSLGVSGDGEQFCTVSGDRRVRVFRTRTGRLRCVLDESLDAAAAAQRAGPPAVRLEEIDYGRRAAAERELGRSWAGAPPFATPAAAAAPPGQPPPPPPPPPGPNAVFDESGHFLIYATHLGVKVVSLDAPGRVARLLGRVEAGERFTRLALFQGAPGRDKRARGGGAGGDEAAARARAAPGGAVGGAGAPPPASADPTLVCCAFRKPRLYLFTRREPVDPGDEPGGGGRDVFNERPTAEDAAARALLAPAPASAALPCGATIHTSLGDVGVRLYGAEAPRTVENWATLARTGYYDGLLFHRVVKGFMLQTGDPLGDGTGGASCWGGEFEDEIRRDLRHDRPYTLSMANAGPNTNGSQFFITTVATPWLDGKHTVFGRLTRGADVVHTIERAKTLRGDKPATDIRMLGITLE